MRPFLQKQIIIDAVEMHKGRAEIARGLGIAHNFYREDFLEFALRYGPTYRRCLMNPPFAVQGNAHCYVNHLWAGLGTAASGRHPGGSLSSRAHV
jgi:hypothetical protein